MLVLLALMASSMVGLEMRVIDVAGGEAAPAAGRKLERQGAGLVEVCEAPLEDLLLQPHLDRFPKAAGAGEPAFADRSEPLGPPPLVPFQEAPGEGFEQGGFCHLTRPLPV